MRKVNGMTTNNDCYLLGEVIYDMTFAMTHRWRAQPTIIREQMMDNLNGSRGLYDWIYEQALNFEEMWQDLPDNAPQREDYYNVVDRWIDDAFNKLVLDLGYNDGKR